MVTERGSQVTCLGITGPPPTALKNGGVSTVSLVMATQQLMDLQGNPLSLYSDALIWFEGLRFKHFGHEAAQKAADSHVCLRQAFPSLPIAATRSAPPWAGLKSCLS